MFTEKNKKINRLTLKHVLFLITYTIALIWIMLHLNEVFDTVSMIIGMLRPFIYGIMMAFVFNIPMKFFLKKLPDNLGRWKKALAAVCSLLIIFGILAFIVRIVMPQVIESIAALANSLPGYIEDAQKTITSMIEKQQIPQDVLKQVDTYSAQLQDTLVNLLKNGIPHLLTMASGFASSLANVFMALVIAVYLTVSKDKLLEQSHRFLYAFTSSRASAAGRSSYQHNLFRLYHRAAGGSGDYRCFVLYRLPGVRLPICTDPGCDYRLYQHHTDFRSDLRCCSVCPAGRIRQSSARGVLCHIRHLSAAV